MKLLPFLVLCFMILVSCNPPSSDPISPATPFAEYSRYDGSLWLDYSPSETTFKIWAPTALSVEIHLYPDGDSGERLNTLSMTPGIDHVWMHTEKGDLAGKYYTFQVTTQNGLLAETPGIYAKATGVNGKRAMILDMAITNPEGWDSDNRVILESPNDAIIYELHVRDITMHPNSGSSMAGKYLGLVESGTKGPKDLTTGIDHMKELGITHVHLLPSYDHYSIDESKLDSAQFNWGYDPQNYNIPEGSYSSDPYRAEVRIKEFKEMVKTFHDNGIGVILDVVYNHTGITEGANFNQEVPGYYYRQREDGSWSDASACGNETASDRPMMRNFIRSSVKYWAEEYHLDGFRFDLMAIHDIETMNLVASDLKQIDTSIFVYGEGWTAGDSPLPENDRALKKHGARMPNITVFSDDIRDGLKGSVFDDMDTGFASGKPDMEESIKFGIVGSIEHDQIDYDKVNYSDAPYATNPWEAISYVSCHDNHTLFDKLTISRPDASLEEIKKMHKLANAVVLTSQGIPFLHAGVELMRTKGGEHNSYKSSDEINQIDWQRKSDYREVFDYYRQLIQLRKEHPAFRLRTGDQVRKNLKFLNTAPGTVAFQLENYPNGDSWKEIMVFYNATTDTKQINIEGNWNVAFPQDRRGEPTSSKLSIPPISMVIAYQE